MAPNELISHLYPRLMARMEAEIPHLEYQRWLTPLKPREALDGALIIQVPNIFYKTWIEDHYLVKMNILAAEIRSERVTIELVCQKPDDHSETAGHRLSGTDEGGAVSGSREAFSSGLMPKYVFGNFVVGSSNQLAHAASLAVANRSASYNPLFLYGGSGLGKTHLLNAIGNHLVNHYPQLKVAYLSSEQFTNELIEALRTEGMSQFRQKYRQIDALMIDDIHFIGGKERTQEEFFYTFNTLYEAEKQVVLSSDKMPKDIPDLEDRLRSRFEGGLFADISPPDRETKVAILTRKAEEEGMELTTDVGFYLASHKETNIRVLEGYLARLGAYSSLTKKPIDLETAQRLLGLFMQADRQQINLDLILKVTADYFRLKVHDLKSVKKNQTVATPRQAAMYLARQLTDLSTVEIGQRLGGRDHSTVIHAVKKIDTRIQEDQVFARTISDLIQVVRSSAAQKDY